MKNQLNDLLDLNKNRFSLTDVRFFFLPSPFQDEEDDFMHSILICVRDTRIERTERERERERERETERTEREREREKTEREREREREEKERRERSE